MTNIVSHNTELMRDWASRMGDKTNIYDEYVSNLYNLVEQFVGSEDFKGGLSTDFEETVLNQRPAFERYSSTFTECIELIKNTATNIDSDEAELRTAIQQNNPLDGLR